MIKEQILKIINKTYFYISLKSRLCLTKDGFLRLNVLQYGRFMI